MRYRFGDYMLDTQRHELQCAGAPITLRRKVFQVLVYLLAHRDRVVPKQETPGTLCCTPLGIGSPTPNASLPQCL